MKTWHYLFCTMLASTTSTHAFASEDLGEPAQTPANSPEQESASTAKPSAKAFSTGVAKGRDLLDSAISASMIDENDLAKLSVSSIAGIMQNIPGIRSETSDTDGYSSITVRGLPMSADGSKYLQLQEDGLPVLEFSDISSALVDQFIRADLSLSQVQAIRGGSASTFASNSPGGLVNFISKTGETAGGAVQISSGLGHDLKRMDFSYGSPLGEGWRFHVGGFYRQGEGPRNIGYDAFRGGQVKLNITKAFANGYIRFYGKYLDDRQPVYSFYPVVLSGTNANPQISNVPGSDVLGDAFGSAATARYLGVDANNRPTAYDGREGARGIVKSVGLEAQIEIAGWTVSNKFRFSDIGGSSNDNLPLLSAPAAAVAGFTGGVGGTLAYATGPQAGQAVTAGLVNLNVSIRRELTSMDNVTNDLRASRVWTVGSGKLTATGGVYASSQDIGSYLTVGTFLNDTPGNGESQLINAFAANGTALSQNGTYGYGLTLGSAISNSHQTIDVNYRVIAPYGSLNYQFGKIAIGGSLRYDSGKVKGSVLGAEFGNAQFGAAAIDINGDGLLSVPERNVAILPLGRPADVDYGYDYLSYSMGINYRLAESASVFARYSRGARASADRVLGAGSFSLVTGQLVDPSAAFGYVKQAEAGVKYRNDWISAYLTGFWASTRERNTQIGADSTGQATQQIINREYSAKGVELETEVRHEPFALTLGATWTKAEIKSDLTAPANAGNRPRHIPSLAFQARPQVEFDRVTFGTVINGTTSSFAQDSNILKQPGYVLVSPFLQFRPVSHLQVGINAFNVFNKVAVVQLGSAAIPASGIVNAQVMNGRTVTGSVRFTF